MTMLTKKEVDEIKAVIDDDSNPMWQEKTEVFDFYHKHFVPLLEYIDEQEELIQSLERNIQRLT